MSPQTVMLECTRMLVRALLLQHTCLRDELASIENHLLEGFKSQLEDESKRYEYCVTNAQFAPKPLLGHDVGAKRDYLNAYVFEKPQIKTETVTSVRGNSATTYADDEGWEYVRHDCLGNSDDCTVLVTWRRPLED